MYFYKHHWYLFGDVKTDIFVVNFEHVVVCRCVGTNLVVIRYISIFCCWRYLNVGFENLFFSLNLSIELSLWFVCLRFSYCVNKYSADPALVHLQSAVRMAELIVIKLYEKTFVARVEIKRWKQKVTLVIKKKKKRKKVDLQYFTLAVKHKTYFPIKQS